MITVSDEILAEMVQTIVREVDPERIYLFGSRARGNERADSDVDLLIIGNRTPGGERYRAVSGGDVSGKSEGAGSLQIAAAQAAVK